MTKSGTYDQDRNCDRAVLEVQGLSAANDVDKEYGIGGVKNDLQHSIGDDEESTVLAVAAGKLVPDHDHGDTSSDADHDDTSAIRWEVRERCPCQAEHDERTDDPIEDEAKGHVYPEFLGKQDVTEGFVTDFGQDGPHHDDESDGDSWAC